MLEQAVGRGDDGEAMRWGRLWDLCVMYRESDDSAERRRFALSFSRATRQDWRDYLVLTAGRMAVEGDDGRWRIVDCNCRFCVGKQQGAAANGRAREAAPTG